MTERILYGFPVVINPHVPPGEAVRCEGKIHVNSREDFVALAKLLTERVKQKRGRP